MGQYSSQPTVTTVMITPSTGRCFDQQIAEDDDNSCNAVAICVPVAVVIVVVVCVVVFVAFGGWDGMQSTVLLVQGSTNGNDKSVQWFVWVSCFVCMHI